MRAFLAAEVRVRFSRLGVLVRIDILMDAAADSRNELEGDRIGRGGDIDDRKTLAVCKKGILSTCGGVPPYALIELPSGGVVAVIRKRRARIELPQLSNVAIANIPGRSRSG